MSKTPTRMCLGCRGRSPKEELLRFVWRNNSFERDGEHNKGGRGVYLHDEERCLLKPPEVGRWRRALRLREEEILTFSEIVQTVQKARQ